MGISERVDRRAFLVRAPLGAVGVGAFLLSACQAAPSIPAAPTTTSPGASTTGQPTSAASAAAQPTAAAPTAAGYPVSLVDTFSPKPDLPSTGQWIDNAYVNYPPNPQKAVNETPGRGGSMSYFTQAVY